MAKHDIIKLRRGTALEWENSLPQPGGEVLKLGEPGYEKDTGKLKIGDGVNGWNDLSYIAAGVIVVEDIDHLVNEVLQPGSGIVLSFNDSNDTLTISSSGINNPLDNTILTSDGTSTGINAESNFTYNDTNSAVVLSREGTGNTSLQLIQSSEVSAAQNARIDLTRNRGTLSSPLPLNSGDFIGSINFNTQNSAGSNSAVAQITAFTNVGLSTYDNPPTVLRIGNRTTDGSFSYIFVRNDGTFNPTSGAVINDVAKSVAFDPEGTRSTALQVFNSVSLNDGESSSAGLHWSYGVADPSSSINYVTGSFASAFITIPSGQVNSGAIIGHVVSALRNSVGDEDDGNINQIIGQNIVYGHSVLGNSTTPSTIFGAGISVGPFAGKGEMTTAYDIHLRNTVYDAVIDASGTIKYGDGTITDRYGIVQDSADPNILNGSLTVGDGLSAPKKIYDLGAVSGNSSISYSIDKQIQIASLSGTATNFIEGSGWPSTTSVEILIELTVSATTSVTWSIVDDWYNPAPTFDPGKYLVLLRSMGTTIQGHYIGAKTN
jgi:hypothetical protein